MTDHDQRLKEHKEAGGTTISFLRDHRPCKAERELRTVTKADIDLSELEGE